MAFFIGSELTNILFLNKFHHLAGSCLFFSPAYLPGKPCAQTTLSPVHKPVGNPCAKPPVDNHACYTQDGPPSGHCIYPSGAQAYASRNSLILQDKNGLPTEKGLLINSINIKLLKYFLSIYLLMTCAAKLEPRLVKKRSACAAIFRIQAYNQPLFPTVRLESGQRGVRWIFLIVSM